MRKYGKELRLAAVDAHGLSLLKLNQSYWFEIYVKSVCVRSKLSHLFSNIILLVGFVTVWAYILNSGSTDTFLVLSHTSSFLFLSVHLILSRCLRHLLMNNCNQFTQVFVVDQVSHLI